MYKIVWCFMQDCEKRVKELCTKAIAAKSEGEIELFISELRSVLCEHALMVQNQISEYSILHSEPDTSTLPS